MGARQKGSMEPTVPRSVDLPLNCPVHLAAVLSKGSTKSWYNDDHQHRRVCSRRKRNKTGNVSARVMHP